MNKRKDFDKLVQKCKRQYWYRSQEELIRLSDTDSKQFWRKIGKIGIGNERQLNIPNEVTLDDGSITDNSDIVLNKWKNCFQTLLNLNVDSNSDRIENYSIKENIVCNELDDEITINEVYKIVMGAKMVKAQVSILSKQSCVKIKSLYMYCINYLIYVLRLVKYQVCGIGNYYPNTKVFYFRST